MCHRPDIFTVYRSKTDISVIADIVSNITDIGYIGDISTDISDVFIPGDEKSKAHSRAPIIVWDFLGFNKN